MDEARLQEQAWRNAIRAQQEIAEVRAYEKTYGKVRAIIIIFPVYLLALLLSSCRMHIGTVKLTELIIGNNR